MDNYFQNCPPMMEDGGRQFTDYKTATRRNEYIKYINDIVRDDQFRLFLQLNGQQFADKEWEWHKRNNSCWDNDCVHVYPTRSIPRHLWQEREVYDSLYNRYTHDKYSKLRECKPMKDFRMTSEV